MQMIRDYHDEDSCWTSAENLGPRVLAFLFLAAEARERLDALDESAALERCWL